MYRDQVVHSGSTAIRIGFNLARYTQPPRLGASNAPWPPFATVGYVMSPYRSSPEHWTPQSRVLPDQCRLSAILLRQPGPPTSRARTGLHSRNHTELRRFPVPIKQYGVGTFNLCVSNVASSPYATRRG